MQVLVAAANATQIEANFDTMDYIISLAEGIMDAWGGIILALKQGKGMLIPDINSFLLIGYS